MEQRGNCHRSDTAGDGRDLRCPLGRRSELDVSDVAGAVAGVDHDSVGPDPLAADQLRDAGRGDDELGGLDVPAQVLRQPVAQGHRGASRHQEHPERLAEDRTLPDHNSLEPREGDVVGVEQAEDPARGCGVESGITERHPCQRFVGHTVDVLLRRDRLERRPPVYVRVDRVLQQDPVDTLVSGAGEAECRAGLSIPGWVVAGLCR